MMDLLFVLPEYEEAAGGIATYYTTLIPEIVSQGYSVDVLVGSAWSSARSPYEQNGVRVDFLDPSRREKAYSALDDYEAVPALRRTLAAAWALFEQAGRGNAYDVVETTDFELLFLPWIACDETPPTLVQLHASNGQIDAREPKAGKALQGHLTRLMEVQGLSQAAELQTYSKANVQEWERRLGREVTLCLPPLRSGTRSGAELSTVDSDASGFVAGRIQYWKGPTTLCKAQAHLDDRAPLIDWAGRDMDWQALGKSMSNHLAETYPHVWGEKVRPIGQISRAEVLSRQRAAQVVVIPSIWDVFNYTAVEAMSLESVVVCSEGAGASDLIEDGENGFCVPAKDPEALAEALQTAHGLSPADRDRIGTAGRKTVQEQLDPSRIARRRIDAFRGLSVKQRPERDADWLSKAIHPDKTSGVSSKPLAFLDRLPLRDLSAYVLRRIGRKMGLF